MNTSTVTTKGQVTLPAPIREELNIGPGSKVSFDFDKKRKEVVIRPLYPFKSFKELKAFGMWKDRKDIGDALSHERKIRKEAWRGARDKR
jgi:antitoxin PrlF